MERKETDECVIPEKAVERLVEDLSSFMEP